MVNYDMMRKGLDQAMNVGGMPVYANTHIPPPENLIPNGTDCAVYDLTAPAKYKFFKYNKGSAKNKDAGPLEKDMKAKCIEIKMDTEKSPIAKLNEIMLLKKKEIEYELVSMTGLVHNPEFTFRIKTDELVVCGSGSSKKEAKRNAATAYLDQMDCSNGINTITSTTSNTSPTPFILNNNEDHTKKIIETKSEVNPIGLLQEMCMARHCELPNYDFLKDELNETHNPWYSVTCCLKNHKTMGQGKTKQLAKRNAALHMYNIFKDFDSPCYNVDTPNYGEYQSPIKAMLSNNSSTHVDYTKRVEKLNSSDVLKGVESFLNTLKSSNKPGLNKLKLFNYKNEFQINAVDLLDQIGKEEEFETKYVMISNFYAQCGILVQVSITPLLVNMGIGNTLEEAQQKAAFSTLLYLKVLLEK